MSTEIWKDVIGYEGFYQVSNKGRVRSVTRIIKRTSGDMKFKSRIMAGCVRNGYKIMPLSKNKTIKAWRVHRLVAIAFIPNPENKAEVNHKNGIRLDNKLDNLEWMTHQENVQHAFRTGLVKVGSQRKDAKLTEKDVIAIRSNRQLTQKELAIKYNITPRHIRTILSRRSWKHVN